MLAPLAPSHHLPFRDLRRLGEILRVFAKHGWQHTILRLQLHHYLQGSVTMVPTIATVPVPADTGLTAIARLRMALEQLGPAFVKFGQMLRVRPDSVPARCDCRAAEAARQCAAVFDQRGARHHPRRA